MGISSDETMANGTLPAPRSSIVGVPAPPGVMVLKFTFDQVMDPHAWSFAKAGDAAKPEVRQQRVAVVGDSDFLADSNVSALGNKELGLNLVQWLASRDALLNIDVPKAPDTSLYLPGWATWLVVVGYTLVLPILLLGYGITRWVRRRRR